MTITDFTPWTALGGGVLIGTAMAIALLLNGRIAGISGIASRALSRSASERNWRLIFLAGLIGGAAVTFVAFPSTSSYVSDAGWALVLAGGFIVGVGTRLGAGCTSGHGVAGLAAGSRRSLVATATFMATAFATVYVVRHLIEG